MQPIEIIKTNFPHCKEWSDESFLGILDGESRLDISTYWKLEWALISLTSKKTNFTNELNWPVFRIFSHAMLLLKADANPNDGYKVVNLDSDRSRDFTERFQMVFEGFFKGEVPDLDMAFDEKNPLLKNQY